MNIFEADIKQYLEASFSTDSTKRAFKNIISLVSRKVGKKFMGGAVPLKFNRKGTNYYGYTYYSDNKAVRFNLSVTGGSTSILSVDVWTSPGMKPQLMADIQDQGLNLVQTVNLVAQMLRGKKGEIEVDADVADGDDQDPFMKKRSSKDAEEMAATHEDEYEYRYIDLGETIEMVNEARGRKPVRRIRVKVKKRGQKEQEPVESTSARPKTRGKYAKRVNVRSAYDETSELEQKFKDNPLFGRAGVESFDQIEAFVKSVIKGRRMGLLITGDPGVGKTFTVQKELDKAGVRYEEFKGNIKSATNLYSLLFDNNDPDKILVFDDCDSVLQDEAQTEILKGALDDKKIRLISYIAKNLMTPEEYIKYLISDGNKEEAVAYANSVKLTNDPKIKAALMKKPTFEDALAGGFESMQAILEARVVDDTEDDEEEEDEEPTGKKKKGGDDEVKVRGAGAKLPLPNKFAYVGRMIVISNLYQSSIPGALRTRLNPVELDLKPTEIMARIKDVNLSIGGASKQDIMKVWNFINSEVAEYLNKMDFRSFSNAVKVYLDLDGKGPWKKWVGTSLVNTFGKFGGASEKKRKR